MGAIFESLIAAGVVLVLVIVWALAVLTHDAFFQRRSVELVQQPARAFCRDVGGGRCTSG